MLDFTGCSTGDLDIARTVVSKLTDLAALDPMNVMILGAECRNLLHTAQGHTFPLRRTNDVDIAIALSDWNTYDDLVRRSGGIEGRRFTFDFATKVHFR